MFSRFHTDRQTDRQTDKQTDGRTLTFLDAHVTLRLTVLEIFAVKYIWQKSVSESERPKCGPPEPCFDPHFCYP